MPCRTSGLTGVAGCAKATGIMAFGGGTMAFGALVFQMPFAKGL
jgi:hypothetical protein